MMHGQPNIKIYKSLTHGRLIAKINNVIGTIYGKIQSFFQVKQKHFSSIKKCA
jgi:hypothetical protein